MAVTGIIGLVTALGVPAAEVVAVVAENMTPVVANAAPRAGVKSPVAGMQRTVTVL
jgi:hypothetical protein